jgi:uncharacterized protein YggU (UPF0235/DUF167 family)
VRINIRVVAGASLNKEEMMPDGSLKVWLRQRPHDGQANEALIEFLAERFDAARSRIRIIKGATSRNKVVEIL